MTSRAIETTGLTRRFGKLDVITGLNLRVPPGSIFALVGPNGAGKTTTLKVLGSCSSPPTTSRASCSRQPSSTSSSRLPTAIRMVTASCRTSKPWIYTHTPLSGSAARQGTTLGSVGWVGQVPIWLLWYAQQPWPGALVVKQLGLELVASVVIGLTISHTAGQPQRVAALGHTG